MTEQPAANRDSGLRLLRAGDVEGAAYFFQQAIEQDPQDGRTRGFLGACLARQGQIDAAILQLQEAARLQPQEAPPQHNLGVVLYQNGFLAEAKNALERALALDPAHAKARDLYTRIRENAPPAPATSPTFDMPPPPAFEAAPPPLSAAPDPTIIGAAPILTGATPDPTLIGAAPAFGQPTVMPPTVNYGPAMLPRFTELARQELPDLPCRINRGLLWGSAYGQAWFLCSFLAIFLIATSTSGGPLLLRFLVVALCSAIFGALLGILIAVLNSDEDAAGNVGIAFGIVGWVIQLLFIGVGWYTVSVFAWFFVGRFIGRGISEKVREPIMIEPT